MLFFFFFNDTATTEIYTLSLHDALPISPEPGGSRTAQGPVAVLVDARTDDTAGGEARCRPGRARRGRCGSNQARRSVLIANTAARGTSPARPARRGHPGRAD